MQKMSEMAGVTVRGTSLWRLIVVGGHTRSIGKTQLVCDVIRAFPRTEWTAGKVTQYGHGVCARNGENCDCAPTDHVCALDWETRADTGTDSARFLEAGAKQSFWLRTKQGYLAEGLPLLRQALHEIGTQGSKEKTRALIVESNSLMQFVRPSLYFAVIDPMKDDFKESAQMALDRAHALVMRGEVGGDGPPAPLWMRLPEQLMREKPSVLQREGEKLPEPLWALVHRILEGPPGVHV
jgi:molybdopterin-guanine dinucleotide biosynthesis protein